MVDTKAEYGNRINAAKLQTDANKFEYFKKQKEWLMTSKDKELRCEVWKRDVYMCAEQWC